MLRFSKFSVMNRFLLQHRAYARIILLLSAVIFIILPIKAFAVSSVSFKVGSVESKQNRLVELSVSAEGSGKLSAALFTFDYDAAMLEFRDVKTASDSIAEFYDSRGRVNISFLCSNGADLSQRTQIFTLVFMSVSQGSCDLNYSVSDCVDSEARQMSVGECVSGRIIIKASGSGTDSSSQKSIASERDSSGGERASSAAKSSSNSASKTEDTNALSGKRPEDPYRLHP